MAFASGNAVSPALVNAAPWVAVEHEPYLLGWPMAETSDMTAHSATLNVVAPANLPVIAAAPGGGNAMLCETTDVNGHSEMFIPVDKHAAPDVFLAFDSYLDAASMVDGGSPFADFLQFVRVGGLGPSHTLLTYLARYADRLDWHTLGSLGADTHEHFPLDAWVRFVVRWRDGLDGLGEIQVWAAGVDLGAEAHSLGECEQLRVRARTNGDQTTLRQWFRNVALADTYDAAFNATPNIPSVGGGGHAPDSTVPILEVIGEL